MLKRIYVVLFLLFFLVGCANQTPKEYEIIFTEEFIAAQGYTQSTWAHELRKDGVYEEVGLNQDDGSVALKINNHQQEYWHNNIQLQLRSLRLKIGMRNQSYKFVHADDCKTAELYFDAKLDEKDASRYLKEASLYCSLRQLIEGEDKDNWYVNISIYNSDTNQLVKSATNREAISLPTKKEWASSSVK